LLDLFKNYGTEDQCIEALFKEYWPDGFRCPWCGSGAHSVLKTRKLYQYSDCHHQTSLISGTIFEQTKLPLTIWFLAIHLITSAKAGLSALSLKRQIGMPYNTAWSMKQKIMQVMKERDDSKPLSGIIQLDDVYWGGERRGGKRGRGSANKVPFVAAVSLNEEGHPIAMNMNVVKGFRLTEISRWAKQHLQPRSLPGSTLLMVRFHNIPENKRLLSRQLESKSFLPYCSLELCRYWAVTSGLALFVCYLIVRPHRKFRFFQERLLCQKWRFFKVAFS